MRGAAESWHSRLRWDTGARAEREAGSLPRTGAGFAVPGTGGQTQNECASCEIVLEVLESTVCFRNVLS